MASGWRFVCDYCAATVEAWDDGNPYYLDAAGTKVYAYHPNATRNQCIGNDVPYVCLDCGSEVTVDSNGGVLRYSECNSSDIVESTELAGKLCPGCKHGHFARDEDYRVIS